MGIVEILWAITGVVVPILYGVGIEMVKHPNISAAKVCFFASAAMLAVMDAVWIMTTDSPLYQRAIVSGIVGAAMLIGLTESLRWASKAEAQEKPMKVTQLMPDKPGVNITGGNNIINYGNSGNNTIINGPLDRHLSQDRAAPARDAMLRFPKDKPIRVVAVMGDAEAFQFASEILAFLKDHHLQANGVDQAIFTGPVIGLEKKELPNGGIEIIVGANK